MQTPNSIFNKVLFVAPDDKYGGIGAVVRIYAKNMKGFKCIATYPSVPLKSKMLFFLLSVVEVTKTLMLDKKIKILHLHSASNGSFVRKSLIALLGKVFGKKVVIHMHGGSFNLFYERASFFKPVIRILLKSCDKLICLSPHWYDYYHNTLGVSEVITVPNPVELSNGNYRFSISPTLKLLFLGKICDDKGIFNLVDYLRTNKYFLDNRIILSIGGVGEDARLLHEIALLSNIEFYGWADETTKNQLLSECDVFILPSRFEGLPVSILEAMAYQKPIIATDVGGISSIVTQGYNGWLVNPSDLGMLDNVFDEIFNNRMLLRQYGLNSYNQASKYSSDQVIHRLSNIYQSLLSD
ncbi:MAG: glycosyltransferase family 4 protein [bacterium]